MNRINTEWLKAFVFEVNIYIFNSVLVNNEVLNIWHEDQRDEIVLSLIKNCYGAFYNVFSR